MPRSVVSRRIPISVSAWVPFGTVHVYGLSRRQPSFAAAVKLARALGVSLDEFAACSEAADEAPNPPRKSRLAATKRKPRRKK